MPTTTRTKKIRWILAAIAAAAILWSWAAGTITYPYVLLARQTQLVGSCQFGSNSFVTPDYGFAVEAPSGFCFLPNRLFPADGSVQVIPHGLYSVISEYAYGSIVAASRSTLLFEPANAGRNPDAVIVALRNGGFLQEASVEYLTNEQGLHYVLAKNVRGIDPKAHFTWAFLLNPDGTIFLSILNAHPDDSTVFNHLLRTLHATQLGTK